MAALVDADFQAIRNIVRSEPAQWAAFKVWSMSKAQYRAAFQAMETWFVDGVTARPATSLKAALEAAIGATLTIAQVKLIGYAWAGWRFAAKL